MLLSSPYFALRPGVPGDNCPDLSFRPLPGRQICRQSTSCVVRWCRTRRCRCRRIAVKCEQPGRGPRVLIVSNGHGEDSLGVLFAQALRRAGDVHVDAFPIVGLGDAYRRARIPVVGVQQPMPTGGFVRQGLRPFLTDVRAGLLGLARRQLRPGRDAGPVRLGGGHGRRPSPLALRAQATSALRVLSHGEVRLYSPAPGHRSEVDAEVARGRLPSGCKDGPEFGRGGREGRLRGEPDDGRAGAERSAAAGARRTACRSVARIARGGVSQCPAVARRRAAPAGRVPLRAGARLGT